MAWANLGRSRGKTAVTVLSLSLAVVLLTMTVTFTSGFDMDKYVSNFTASDFIVADAGQFQTGGDGFNADMGVPQSVMDDIDAQGGITDGGLVYGKTSACPGVCHRGVLPLHLEPHGTTPEHAGQHGPLHRPQ